MLPAHKPYPATFPCFHSPSHTFSPLPQTAKIITLVREVLFEALLLPNYTPKNPSTTTGKTQLTATSRLQK